jgi:transposase
MTTSRHTYSAHAQLALAHTSRMAALLPELPHDLTSCQLLIRQLQAAAQDAAERIATCAAMLRDSEARAQHLAAQLTEYQETVASQQETITRQAEDIVLLKRCLFGSRRERYVDDPGQTFLFPIQVQFGEATKNTTPDTPEPAAPTKNKRTSQGRRPRVFPEFLPREEERLKLKEADIPPELLQHPNARRFYKKTSERIEMIPAQFKVVEQWQECLAVDLPDETTRMFSAQRPPTLIQSYAGVSLLSYLTVCRFADHLPYYRLEDILGRSGLSIDRSTQWRWMHRLALGVTPLVDLMWDRVRLGQIIAMDETPVRELGGCGKTLTGYLWTGVGDAEHPYDCFFYTSDRRTIRPREFLSSYRGYLLTDAYIAYERLGDLGSGIVNASCWAHGRRKFEECHHLGATAQTHTALAFLRQLFDLEDVFRPLSDEQRLAARREQSLPIVAAFHAWLEREQARQLPKSKLRGAINYLLNRWPSFARFLEAGCIPLSNNVAERALKYPILGRRAWLFVGNHAAGETAAKLITLTKTCNRLHIDPLAYLQNVYARLPAMTADELPALLPDRWLQEHPEHMLSQRVQEAIERAQRAAEERAVRRRAA